MKKIKLFNAVAILLVAVFAISCSKTEKYEYQVLVPVYKSFDEFRASFKATPPQVIQQPGKIYFKDNYIFLNEVNEGIHVINNANPSNPVPVTFYEIEGNVDMAIRGNILFADSYIDLVAIDISNILQPVEVSRLENAFPNVLPIAEFDYPVEFPEEGNGVVVGWKVEKRVGEPSWIGGLWRWFGGELMSFDASGGQNTVGIAGSMARLMLNNNYLYSVTTPWRLTTLDVADVTNMFVTDSIDTWREMETLFKYQNHLLVGTTTGMVIYNIDNPAAPQFVSDFNHVNSCDPVVVHNNIAYVTLRSGNECNGFTNQLDVIDISNIQQPSLLKSYPMFNPHGLGIDLPLLFICDGAAGLKVYNATNPLAISSNMIAHFPNIDAFDVIPLGNVLLMTGHDGLFQYDYSNPQNIVLLSHIKIKRKR
jgi:hypothetical protein